jgi:cytochrome P450
MHSNCDPFQKLRCDDGAVTREFRGEKVRLILRHDDVRKAAKNWQTFSSNKAFNVPVPSEEYLRTVRQIPLETDPPEHTEFRKMIEPFFKRAKEPEMIAEIEQLHADLLDKLLSAESVDLVKDYALPYQCKALAILLKLPESEANVWIGFGVNVFLGGQPGEHKGAKLENYLNSMFDRAKEAPGDDFFSALNAMEFQGRKLTMEEKLGYAILAFSGGRDTIIHTCTAAMTYLAGCPEAMAYLREDPSRTTLASEELFRAVSPLTHLGRVCKHAVDVRGETVSEGNRVSLCWASANFDENTFPEAHEVKLDRKPNPHVAFGFGAHLCIGAPHARLLIRTLLQQVSKRVRCIEILESVPHKEEEALFEREVGYDRLIARVHRM